MRNGVCTGGPYGYKHGCRPYAFHPCGHHKDQVYYGECPSKSYETPECRKICQRGYPVTYSKDRFYAASAYFVKNDTKAIMREIMRGGPVHGAYDTYQDFRLYKGGVYEHTAGARTGGHSIKIIGWGNQRYPNGTVVPYWLIANSWNRDWGEGGTCMP
ncbi:hypothetical protein Y032_0619g724 [Ancylostoma ceylanicum]|uniref:Peptidase C1A papain C-terminal domain-containing protein n=1 Tax=Ancylostoma ceylanicum TaxID=53326 RepID=A0A016WL37_9BILA|nr:hypothetical protein Y032_0619g724 [Ancylostoma ceylanicum]